LFFPVCGALGCLKRFSRPSLGCGPFFFLNSFLEALVRCPFGTRCRRVALALLACPPDVFRLPGRLFLPGVVRLFSSPCFLFSLTLGVLCPRLPRALFFDFLRDSQCLLPSPIYLELRFGSRLRLVKKPRLEKVNYGCTAPSAPFPGLVGCAGRSLLV